MQKYRIQAFLLISVAFILGFSEFIIIGLVDPLAQQFGTSQSSIGLLVTSFALVYAFSTPIINLFVGSKLLHRVLIGLLAVFELGNLGTALAQSYEMLTLTRIITAIVSGAIISIVITFGAVIAPREKRAGLIAWTFSGFSIASVFGVPLGTWMSTYVGWRSVFFLITLLGAITTVLLYFVIPHTVRQGKAVKFKTQLQILGDHRIQLGLLTPMLNLAGIYSMYTYLSPIILDKLHFQLDWLTPMLFAYGMMSLFSNLLSGRLADNRGLQRMPWVFVTQTVFLLLLPLLLQERILGLLGLMILGLTMYLNNSPIQMHFMDIAEHDYPQSMVIASSFNSIFANVGIAIGSAAGSWAFESFGLTAVGPTGAVFALMALVVSISLSRLLKTA